MNLQKGIRSISVGDVATRAMVATAIAVGFVMFGNTPIAQAAATMGTAFVLALLMLSIARGRNF